MSGQDFSCQIFGTDYKQISIRENKLIYELWLLPEAILNHFQRLLICFKIKKQVSKHVHFFSGNVFSQRWWSAIKWQRWYGCTCNWIWLSMAMNVALSFKEGLGYTVAENTFCLCPHQKALFPDREPLATNLPRFLFP